MIAGAGSCPRPRPVSSYCRKASPQSPVEAQTRSTGMDDVPSDKHDESDWLEAELTDSLDEDYELELSEPALPEELRKIYTKSHPPTIGRRDYFYHLLRLQAELIKLQDWVQHTKAKLVVIFEGRDSAGKGGVIKRITQRLN